MADQNVDFGITGDKDVLLKQDQLTLNDPRDDIDKLARELDIEPEGRTETGKKADFEDTLPANPDQSVEKQQMIVTQQSAVVLANKPHQDVNINKISPEGHKGDAKYKSRKMTDFQDTDSGAEQTDQEDGSIAMKDNEGNDVKKMPNMRFKNYKNVFQNLIKYRNIATAYPIITMMISYDSTRALTVTKAAENRSILKMYSLKDYDITFHEELGNQPNDYIKCKEMEQTDDGNQFACVYMNDGVFFLRTFGKAKRTPEEIAENEVNINDMLGIDASTMPCQDLSDPFITCCWVGMTKVFVSLFHSGSLTHFHFIYDTITKSLIGANDVTLGEQAVSHKMKGSNKNFPYKSFYSEERDEIYTFYRQGQAFTIKPQDLSDYRFEQMIDSDLDQMVLLYGKALIVRSSSTVLFFKQVYDKVSESWSWSQYNEIAVRGLIYYIKGNIRIQVTTEKYIYFYLIDKETFEPELENLMYNYMQCTQCMFGKRVRYGITYKNNERGFDVYQRKYMHNLKVKVHGQNLEGSKAVEIKSMGKFLVTEIDKVQMYDSYTFEKVGDPLPIKLLPTQTREANEVIGIQVSQCEQYVAVVTGKNLVKNEQKQNQVQMMKRVPHPSGQEDEDTWELYRRIVVKDMPLFNKVVMQFHFKKAPPGEEPSSLIFTKKDIIFELNYQMEIPDNANQDVRVTTIHTMASFCKLQPQFFITNSTQDVFVVSSQSDGLYINLRTGTEIDIDEAFSISDIKSLIYDQEDQMVYILANRCKGVIGFYLMRFPIDDPHKVENLTTWKHNLDIDNANMFISKGNNEKSKYRELVIGYKTIFINTYTVVVKDLSDAKNQGAVLYKHESFQLWESLVSGLLTTFNKDYISFTNIGMNVLALGELKNGKRELIDFEGQPKMIHSLDAYKFLKIDKENYINYKCQYYANRTISIEHEWTKTNTDLNGETDRETKYYDIYKVKIHEITLREIMILQAIYLCKTQQEIENIVRLQPNPQFFYKSFLEFDGANLLSMLSFDSGSVEALLNEENEKYFDPMYPVIYKNKITKKSGNGVYLSSAIDNALRANQVKAVSLIIDYIIKFQNSFISSFLFIRNFPILMEKGVEVTNLLNSSIFNVEFDYDDWPGSHPNDEKCIQPYNGSYFDIRLMYLQVFDGEEFSPDALSQTKDKSKIYKIKYSVNLLGQCGKYCEQDENGEIKVINEDVNLMGLAEETEEMGIFDTPAIVDIIEYRWDHYAMSFHLKGLFMNMLYIISFILYVKEGYIEGDDSEHQKIFLLIMNIGLAYPVGYELTQLVKTGFWEYMSTNQVDVVYYVAGITNIVLQYLPDHGFGPKSVTCKILMCYLVCNMIMKAFFYLRIFESMTGIVVMLTNVISDLRAFMLFYIILLWLCAHMFMVIGLGNNLPSLEDELEGESATLRMLRAGRSSSTGNTEGADTVEELPSPVDGTEYTHIGLYMGTILTTARISIGDFSCIDQSAELLTTADNLMFWFIWLFVMGATCIVFLNFIVAEASASYTVVMETLDQVIQQEKAALISEADGLSMGDTLEKYPKYLITRDKDE